MTEGQVEELIGCTAEEAVARLRRGEVSPLEMVEASARRIEQTDGAVNALPTLCLERARAHARRLQDERPANPGRNYLYGLPIAVKDNLDVEGVRTTHGSRVFADHVARQSDVVVQRLEANGAIVVGKSNLPEFASGNHTYNDVFGTTRNPWNLAMGAGGSSGGAAAALAAGQVWLATGNDFGGSLRIPASFCSVVGFRPSPGLVPRIQKQPFSPLSIEGPMGRTVADAALLFDAEVGWHPADPLTQRCEHPRYYTAACQPALPARIAYSPDLGVAPVVDSEVARVCAQAMASLERAGARVEQACPDLASAGRYFEILRSAIYIGRIGPYLERYRDVLKPELVANTEMGLALSAQDVVAAEIGQGELIRDTAAFFERYDLLACPAALTPPYPASMRSLRELDGVAFESYLGSLVLTYVISMTCCPSISIPCGFTRDGLPVGLQLVGPPRSEYALLSAAAWLEQIFAVQPRTPLLPRGERADAPPAPAMTEAHF